MFRYLIFLSALLLPLQPTQAGTWGNSVPGWIATLSESIGERVSSLTEQNEEHRQQVTCLALAVYYEARGESLRGQRAVASVVMNRVRSPRFPDTACEVIFQRGQFSFVKARLAPRGPAWDDAVEVAAEYIDRPAGDIPHLYFTNSRSLRGLRIGRHVFR